MRKLSMNRPSKLNLAAKKVSPPSLPPPLPGETLALNQSYESYNSDTSAGWSLPPLPPQRPAGFSEPFFPPPPLPLCSPSASSMAEDGGGSCCSSSAYSSSSLLSSVSSPGGVVQPHSGGSRNSVSSNDSGWSGGGGERANGQLSAGQWVGGYGAANQSAPPMSQMRQCRNSNSSLNSDHRTNNMSATGGFSDEMVQLRGFSHHHQQQQPQIQRRYSSIRKKMNKKQIPYRYLPIS